jgi:hypothetical protein
MTRRNVTLVTLLLLVSASAAAQQKETQTRALGRYKRYFERYTTKLRRGVLKPAMVGLVGGAKLHALTGMQAEGGLVRVRDAHGINHLLARGSVGVGASAVPVAAARGGVVFRSQPAGESWRRLTPLVTGELRGTLSLIVGAGVEGAHGVHPGAALKGAPTMTKRLVHAPGERYVYGAVAVTPPVPNRSVEANLLFHIPITTYRTKLRKTVDRGLQAVSKAEAALRSHDKTGTNEQLQQLEQLRQQTRLEAFKLGAVRTKRVASDPRH